MPEKSGGNSKCQMTVVKPRFAVLLDDLKNATSGTLPCLSYGLKDDTDPAMNDWHGSMFDTSGNLLFEFDLTCGAKYPDEVPVFRFGKATKVKDAIKLGPNRNVRPPR